MQLTRGREAAVEIEPTEKLKEFGIANRIAGIAVRRLKKMGILV